MTPAEALDKYRARATVEHLIHSLKRVTGIKPQRVWNESSIRGSMLLALLSEVAIALARYVMKGARKTVTEHGRRRTSVEKPCTEFMVWSLSHLTVTGIIERGVRKKAVSAIGTLYPKRLSPISEPRAPRGALSGPEHWATHAECDKSGQRKL